MYAPYVYLPLACAFCWLAALLAMMGLWVASGKPRYTDDEPSTVFISNVAGKHKVSGRCTACCLCPDEVAAGAIGVSGGSLGTWSCTTRQRGPVSVLQVNDCNEP